MLKHGYDNMTIIITLTSDFGKQTQGVGNMEAVAYEICPEAKVIHLMHGIPDFDIVTGARTMETVLQMPQGYHVCVVDPGVGTQRRGIIIMTKRGDYLIGPDNGVLIPAARLLGINKVVEITNKKYMRQPVSPIFHGRDVFTPAAAYLAKGIALEEFGAQLDKKVLAQPPYEEAVVKVNRIEATLIHINKFGSIHMNITQKEWDKLKLAHKEIVLLTVGKKKIKMPFVQTFGDVPRGKELIMKDDYGRIEIAINQGSFVKKYPTKLLQKIIIQKIG